MVQFLNSIFLKSLAHTETHQWNSDSGNEQRFLGSFSNHLFIYTSYSAAAVAAPLLRFVAVEFIYMVEDI